MADTEISADTDTEISAETDTETDNFRSLVIASFAYTIQYLAPLSCESSALTTMLTMAPRHLMCFSC